MSAASPHFHSLRCVPRAALLCASLLTFCAPRAAAGDEPTSSGAVDHFDLVARGVTHVELFRRALLPGPNGALVESDTSLPVYHSVFIAAHDIDTAWHKDAIDVELSAWARALFGDDGSSLRVDGDVQTANVRYRHGPLAFRLGRQQTEGGALGYLRFDGLTLSASLGLGLEAETYGGLTVLPRWDARPGYHHLGAAADSLLRDPDALPEPDRSGYRFIGGRLRWTSARTRAVVSFNEQHEPEGLSRRALGADGRISILEDVFVGGVGTLDLDAGRVHDARIWVEATPMKTLDVSAEILHTEPALFLSRQSVFSVFSTDAYEEASGSAIFRITDRLTVESAGGVQFYDSRRGARGEIEARFVAGAEKKTSIRLAYSRVLALDNGYHSGRLSLSRRILPALSGTLEAYAYFYDEAIRGQDMSAVSCGTLTYRPRGPVSLLWGASVARSPYASFDAQTLVRLALDFDASSEEPGR